MLKPVPITLPSFTITHLSKRAPRPDRQTPQGLVGTPVSRWVALAAVGAALGAAGVMCAQAAKPYAWGEKHNGNEVWPGCLALHAKSLLLHALPNWHLPYFECSTSLFQRQLHEVLLLKAPALFLLLLLLLLLRLLLLILHEVPLMAACWL